MIDRRKKSHQAENLVSWPYSSEFAATTAMHHTAMTIMYRISGREEATDLAWRLPQQRLRGRPSWLVGACLLANLPSKNMLTTNNCVCRRTVTKMADNGRHGAPLPAPVHTTVAQNVG
jgi:hypothetical protein